MKTLSAAIVLTLILCSQLQAQIPPNQPPTIFEYQFTATSTNPDLEEAKDECERSMLVAMMMSQDWVDGEDDLDNIRSATKPDGTPLPMSWEIGGGEVTLHKRFLIDWVGGSPIPIFAPLVPPLEPFFGWF